MRRNTQPVATIRYTMNERVDAQFVRDMFITALYGGIQYWCQHIKCNEEKLKRNDEELLGDYLIRGGEVSFKPHDEDEWFAMDLAKFMRGLELTLERYQMCLEKFYDNHDSDSADNLLQMALFGKLVYG